MVSKPLAVLLTTCTICTSTRKCAGTDAGTDAGTQDGERHVTGVCQISIMLWEIISSTEALLLALQLLVVSEFFIFSFFVSVHAPAKEEGRIDKKEKHKKKGYEGEAVASRCTSL